MMKRKNILLTTIAATAAVGLAGMTMNAMAAQGTGTATVDIVAPLTITPVGATQLNFGELSGDATNGGTATVTTAGALSAALPVKVTNAAAASQGQFTVSGAPGLTFATTLPASTLVTGPGSPATDMTVDTFASDLALTAQSLGAGSVTMNIGATLNVNANQPAGTYTGSYNVTVVYE